MPKYCAIMLNYAQVRQESYYAQIYASIMCQGLVLRLSLTNIKQLASCITSE